MTTVNHSVLVPYTPAEMFDLVDDVDKYDEFLPWCIKSDVLERDEGVVKAMLQVGMESMHKSFTTANHRHPRDRIEMRLIEGPFRHLQGTWSFTAVDEASCEVKLSMEFEFSSLLLRMAFGKIFQKALDMMVDAFKKRAIEVYGEREYEC